MRIDFHPMPKRFMVWDKSHNGWLNGRSRDHVLDLVDISKELKNNPHLPADCVIVQSTNLFDKDGKEIFESHIIDNKYIVEFQNSKFVLKEISSGSIIDLYGYKGKVTGSALQV